MTTVSSGGRKADESKPPMSLLPFDALEAVARVLGYGAQKYDPHNWRAGLAWSRLESAILRHYTAFQRGEDIDPETGELHLAHLCATALFLLSHQINDLGNDDRYTPCIYPAPTSTNQ